MRHLDANEQVARKSRLFKQALGALAILVTILVGVTAGVVIDSSTKLLDISKNSAAQREQILDCTQPGGDCYTKAQTNQAGAVAAINRTTVAAVLCALRLDAKGNAINDTFAKMASCITAETAKLPK